MSYRTHHLTGEEKAALRASLAEALKARKEIVAAFLYGSAGAEELFQDVDVGVLVERSEVPASADLDYALALSEVLSANLPCPVDVRVVNDAPPAFRYNVSVGDPLFARSPEMLADFRERAWDDYLDFVPVALRYLREMR